MAPYPRPRVTASDQGRAQSRRKGDHADCVVRSLVAVSGLPYDATYDLLRGLGRRWGRGWDVDAWLRKGHPGLNQALMTRGLAPLHFQWIGFPPIKGRPRVTLAEAPLAFTTGPYLLSLGRHVVAMVDGVLIDDGGRDYRHRGSRCLYGAWSVTPILDPEHELYLVKLLRASSGTRYEKTLGTVLGVSPEDALGEASLWFEHRVPLKGADLSVALLTA